MIKIKIRMEKTPVLFAVPGWFLHGTSAVPNDTIDPITGSVPHKALLCTITKLY